MVENRPSNPFEADTFMPLPLDIHPPAEYGPASETAMTEAEVLGSADVGELHRQWLLGAVWTLLIVAAASVLGARLAADDGGATVMAVDDRGTVFTDDGSSSSSEAESVEPIPERVVPAGDLLSARPDRTTSSSPTASSAAGERTAGAATPESATPTTSGSAPVGDSSPLSLGSLDSSSGAPSPAPFPPVRRSSTSADNSTPSADPALLTAPPTVGSVPTTTVTTQTIAPSTTSTTESTSDGSTASATTTTSTSVTTTTSTATTSTSSSTVTSSSAVTSAPTTTGTSGSGQLIWSDEFDSLDTARWAIEHSTYGDGNSELQCYRPENVSVAGGRLILQAVTETYTCPNGSTRSVTSGMVRSRGLTFRPGQALEFKVKLTPADEADQGGLWPAVWASGWGGGGWPVGGELDFLEVMTANDPRRSIFSMHYAKADRSHGVTNKPTFGSRNFSADWHVVRFEYGGGGRLVWFLDGRQVLVVTAADTLQGYPRPFDLPITELKMNLALGGRPGPLSPNAVGSAGARFEVDFVRLYEL